MEDKRKRRSRSIAVAAVVCVVALVVIGVTLWHPWDPGVPADPESGGEEVASTDDTAGDVREGNSVASDDTASEDAVYTDGGSGSREGRAEYANLDPQIGSFGGNPTQYSYDASIHANKPFIFVGTVTESDEMSVSQNRYEIPRSLTVSVDRVYSGDAFVQGDEVSLFFPISRYVGDDGSITKIGPRIEEGRSYVFFCDLATDPLVRHWMDDRYPAFPALADNFDLVVSWDAYCFPIKDDLVCAWMGNDWSRDDGRSISLTGKEQHAFFEGLFHEEATGLAINDPTGPFYDLEAFGSVVEEAKSLRQTETVQIVNRIVSRPL